MQATAPAKVILFGEHAVVYGKPAIAVPVSSLRAAASVEAQSKGYGLVVRAYDLNEQFRFEQGRVGLSESTLELTVRLVLERLSVMPPDAEILLHSQIPIASGLGSGAAISTALVRALGLALNRSLDDEFVNEIVYEVEKVHHGTPSGIDNTVVVYEKPVYFVRQQRLEAIAIGKPISLLIADTGRTALTRIAVGDVHRLYEVEPVRTNVILDEIGQLVVQARHAIQIGDDAELGRLMVQNQALLCQLTVSSIELDKLVQSALDAGALGAKLSGGGRGGNMIALVTADTLSLVRGGLLKAGALRVFETVVA